MINISELVDEEVRKVIKYEKNGEIKEIIIKNPTIEFAEDFFNKEKNKNKNHYDTLERLLKGLTDIELDIPLEEVIESGYAKIVLQEVISELTIILGEMYRKFALNVNTLIEINDIARDIDKSKKNEIQ